MEDGNCELITTSAPAAVVAQMTSARQGVELLGQYIETLGSAEGYGIQFADAEEAW